MLYFLFLVFVVGSAQQTDLAGEDGGANPRQLLSLFRRRRPLPLCTESDRYRKRACVEELEPAISGEEMKGKFDASDPKPKNGKTWEAGERERAQADYEYEERKKKQDDRDGADEEESERDALARQKKEKEEEDEEIDRDCGPNNPDCFSKPPKCEWKCGTARFGQEDTFNSQEEHGDGFADCDDRYGQPAHMCKRSECEQMTKTGKPCGMTKRLPAVISHQVAKLLKVFGRGPKDTPADRRLEESEESAELDNMDTLKFLMDGLMEDVGGIGDTLGYFTAFLDFAFFFWNQPIDASDLTDAVKELVGSLEDRVTTISSMVPPLAPMLNNLKLALKAFEKVLEVAFAALPPLATSAAQVISTLSTFYGPSTTVTDLAGVFSEAMGMAADAFSVPELLIRSQYCVGCEVAGNRAVKPILQAISCVNRTVRNLVDNYIRPPAEQTWKHLQDLKNLVGDMYKNFMIQMQPIVDQLDSMWSKLEEVWDLIMNTKWGPLPDLRSCTLSGCPDVYLSLKDLADSATWIVEMFTVPLEDFINSMLKPLLDSILAVFPELPGVPTWPLPIPNITVLNGWFGFIDVFMDFKAPVFPTLNLPFYWDEGLMLAQLNDFACLFTRGALPLLTIEPYGECAVDENFLVEDEDSLDCRDFDGATSETGYKVQGILKFAVPMVQVSPIMDQFKSEADSDSSPGREIFFSSTALGSALQAQLSVGEGQVKISSIVSRRPKACEEDCGATYSMTCDFYNGLCNGGCPFLSSTDKNKTYGCADGTECDEFACCGSRGGVQHCPLDTPDMCAVVGESGDYGCRSKGDCGGVNGPNGGLRECFGPKNRRLAVTEATLLPTTASTPTRRLQLACDGDWLSGDGTGSSEEKAGESTSYSHCLQLIQEASQCKNANGATVAVGGIGACYCEFGMTSRTTGKTETYASCYLADPTSPPTPTPTMQPALADGMVLCGGSRIANGCNECVDDTMADDVAWERCGNSYCTFVKGECEQQTCKGGWTSGLAMGFDASGGAASSREECISNVKAEFPEASGALFCSAGKSTDVPCWCRAMSDGESPGKSGVTIDFCIFTPPETTAPPTPAPPTPSPTWEMGEVFVYFDATTFEWDEASSISQKLSKLDKNGEYAEDNYDAAAVNEFHGDINIEAQSTFPFFLADDQPEVAINTFQAPMLPPHMLEPGWSPPPSHNSLATGEHASGTDKNASGTGDDTNVSGGTPLHAFLHSHGVLLALVPWAWTFWIGLQ